MAEDFTDLQMNPEMTAGEMLRTARTTGRRKREIQTISKQLCIREEFLQALEDGDYTVLPEVVYILGFARNYAMELGLNPDLIVAKIKKELGIMKLAEAMVAQKTEQPQAVNVEKTEKIEKEVSQLLYGNISFIKEDPYDLKKAELLSRPVSQDLEEQLESDKPLVAELKKALIL